MSDKTTFRAIASASGGAYTRFDAGSARQLSELLKSAALFASGLVALEAQKGSGATLLLEQLRKAKP